LEVKESTTKNCKYGKGCVPTTKDVYGLNEINDTGIISIENLSSITRIGN
jgi:hypothetical protein